MKIDFSTKILGFDGKPAKSGEGDDAEVMTLGSCAVIALNHMGEKDRDLKAEKKIHRGVLAQDIYNAYKKGDGVLDIPLEDATMIKDLINPLWGPLVIMRVDELLDPKPKDPEKKANSK